LDDHCGVQGGEGREGDEGKGRDRVYTVYMGFFGARHKGTRKKIEERRKQLERITAAP